MGVGGEIFWLGGVQWGSAGGEWGSVGMGARFSKAHYGLFIHISIRED